MSLASKITLATTCVLSVVTIAGVLTYQDNERNGPIKDAARVEERKNTQLEPSLTPQQIQRLAEYEMQKKLQQEYSAVQVVDESQRIQGDAVPLSAAQPGSDK
ncbi:hypothetical protein D0Z03_000542 [Geotrichum reessii]|nr:hypothetical protein D0Z03_000542 [Galactomyces reessii]